MKRTVYLPEDLEVRVSEYLKQNPQVTFSRLVQESLETKLAPRDLSPLLKLAGIVTEVKSPASRATFARREPELYELQIGSQVEAETDVPAPIT